MARYAPERGELVWLDFDPPAGHEQAGKRPALVLSPKAYNQRTSLALIVPVTNRIKGYPFEVPIPSGHPVTGIVLADQAKSLSWQEHGAELVCAAPPAVTRETKGKLRALLQLQ